MGLSEEAPFALSSNVGAGVMLFRAPAPNGGSAGCCQGKDLWWRSLSPK